MKRPPRDDYEVGYRKPPVATQFGRRPQPVKRTRKQPPANQDLRSVLLEKVVLKIDGKTRSVPYPEAFIQTQKHKALQGDPRAARIIIELLKEFGMISAASEVELAPPIINVAYVLRDEPQS